MARGSNSASTYLTSRLKEALYNAKGNKAKAMQQIISWSAQDMQLLQALTRAHLSGIVAYHIDRVAEGKEATSVMPSKSPAAVPRKATGKKPSRKRVDPARGNAFGREILKAASNAEASIFGLETYRAPTRQDEQSSNRQADVMKHLASFSQTPQDKNRH